MQAARTSSGGTPRRPAPKPVEPVRDVLELDTEKLILEWPDAAARLAEDPV
jgi:hypothetical protein